jgi:hypothetical protein
MHGRCRRNPEYSIQGQTDKQANNAAKDLVKRFLSDTQKVEKRNG